MPGRRSPGGPAGGPRRSPEVPGGPRRSPEVPPEIPPEVPRMSGRLGGIYHLNYSANGYTLREENNYLGKQVRPATAVQPAERPEEATA